MDEFKVETQPEELHCKGSIKSPCYVAVPKRDIQDLEKARLELIRMLEATEMLNMSTLLSVTNPMWKITHTKYETVKKRMEPESPVQKGMGWPMI